TRGGERRDQQRHRSRGRPRHCRVDRDFLHCRATVARRYLRDHLVGKTTRRRDVVAHPRFRRRHERQPVAPTRIGRKLLERNRVVVDLDAFTHQPLERAPLRAAVDLLSNRTCVRNAVYRHAQSRVSGTGDAPSVPNAGGGGAVARGRTAAFSCFSNGYGNACTRAPGRPAFIAIVWAKVSNSAVTTAPAVSPPPATLTASWTVQEV